MSSADSLDHVSARIKELYIELDNYAYFHGPSEVHHLDRRFTGRGEVLERLKSLLTDHESPTGAYLVTGFRGAGKSSLVALALADIIPPRRPVVSARRILRIASPVLASTLIKLPWPSLVINALAVLALGLLAYLVETDSQRPDRLSRGPWRRFVESYLPALRRAFILQPEKPPSNRSRALLQDGLAICVLVLAGALSSIPETLWRFMAVLLIVAVYTWLVPLVLPGSVKLLRKMKEPARETFWARSRVVIPHWIHKNLSRRIQVKINLSQDNLKEIDILRSIASSLETEYRRFSRPSFRRLVIRCLLLLPFLILAYQIYDGLLRPWSNDVKRDFHVACFLPSQGHFLFRSEGQDGQDAYFRVLEEHQKAPGGGMTAFRRALDEELRRTVDAAAPPSDGVHGFFHRPGKGLLGKTQGLLLSFTTGADTLVQLLYRETRRGILEPLSQPVARIAKIRWPETLDYFLLVFFGLGWFLPQFLLRWSLFDRPRHRDILRQLRELNEMIDAEVTQERGGVPFQANTLVSLSFGRRQRQTYRSLNEREIEKRLIDVLKHSQRVSPLEVRPEFIVVFDELDKIQHLPPAEIAVPPRGEAEGGTGSKATTDQAFRGREFGSVDVERDRQHRILSLVSNLKHFLSTAPSKFIFIAGREMFDAALADVSDRHFFMGSVFNEVIHVPSFHSDDTDDRLPDITSLPEQYICHFLLPETRRGDQPSLVRFREYLNDVLLPEGSAPPPLLAKQRDKVLYELHNFVTYLTYRSNGAPKRITATLERFICHLPEGARHSDRERCDPRYFVVGRNSRNLYLRFRYQDQYAFGLVTYLASPLIFSVNRAIKDYGDKILVSSSFVLDHIFKFHGHGFSWRNLELLPEVVDINRAPQLRELISHIMRFLSRGHINEIISGLYHFKFTRRISEEISFLSKLSEHESAAFNFTLDESLALKRHFDRQLQRLLATYGDARSARGPKSDFVNSVAFLRMILGDLHYYDGEFDSAIVEYMEAVQQLRQVKVELRPDTLILMTRNYLKLGLAFERKKSFDSALVTYGRISAVLADVCQEHVSRQQNDRPTLRKRRDKGSLQLDPTTIEGIRLIYQPMFARLQLVEKATLGGIGRRDLVQVGREFRQILGVDQRRERFLAESEFHNKVGDILFFKNGPMPRDDVAYCKQQSLGRSTTTLCFENRHRELLVAQRRRLPCAACGCYNKALYVLCRRFLEIPLQELKERDTLVVILESFERRTAAGVGHVYADRTNFLREMADVLSDLGDTYAGCAYAPRQNGGPESDSDTAGSRKPVAGISARFIEILKDLLSESSGGAAGAPGERRRSRLMAKLVAIMRDSRRNRYLKIEEALAYYAVAAILFRLAANNRAASIQMIKILWLLREYKAVVQPQEVWPDSTLLALGTLCIRELHRSHEGTHRLEIERIKEVLEERLDKRSLELEKVDLSRLSINANITEVLVLLREIQMLQDRSTSVVPMNDVCSPFAMFPSVYSRIHALRLRSRIHTANLRRTGLKEALGGFIATGSEEDEDAEAHAENVRAALDELGRARPRIAPDYDSEGAPAKSDSHQGTKLLEMMIVDAAYCNHEIVRLLRIYGRSYMASNSMKAAAHSDLGRWCNFLFAYLRFCHVQEKVTDNEAYPTDPAGLQLQLERALGPADMVHASPNYHREMALRYWKAALQTHGEGHAYQELLEDMFYLNDDFADFLEHFCAAVERFRINSGLIDRNIEKAKKRLAKTSIYQPENYLASLGQGDRNRGGEESSGSPDTR